MLWEHERAKLLSESYLHPPLEILEPAFSSAPAAMLSVISGCERLLGPAGDALPVHAWLGSLKNREGLAFYGSAMHSPDNVSDVDILSMSPFALPSYHLKPSFVHVHSVSMDSERPGEDGPLFCGSLLFLSMPPQSLLGAIDSARVRILESPLFDGGVGELITHAAFKALEHGDAPSGLKSQGFMLRRQWLDTSGMETKTYSPHELNNQIRMQMQGLPDEDAYALALAGMRRIRVRRDVQDALAQKFVSHLRAKKIHGSFG